MVVDLLLLTLLFLYLLLTEASRHVSRSPRDILVELKGRAGSVHSEIFCIKELPQSNARVRVRLNSAQSNMLYSRKPPSCKWLHRGGGGAPAGLALAGSLFCELLVSFPDCIGAHVLLNKHAYTTCSC